MLNRWQSYDDDVYSQIHAKKCPDHVMQADVDLTLVGISRLTLDEQIWPALFVRCRPDLDRCRPALNGNHVIRTFFCAMARVLVNL
jgi:hypothetical protein